MQEVVDSTPESQARRIHMPSPSVEQANSKEVKRRSRYDPVLDRQIGPDERDAIRAYQAKHDGEYPPKYSERIAEVELKRQQEQLKRRNANTVGKISKPVSAPAPKMVVAPKTVPVHIRAQAKDLVSEVLAENTEELNELTPEAYTKLQLSLLKKFEAILSK